MKTETVALFALSLLAAGCGDKGGDSGAVADGGAADGGAADGGAAGGGAAGDGGGAVSDAWADTQANLEASCAFSGCHVYGDVVPDLTAASSYTSLVGVESGQAPGEILVVPGDADASYLVKKVEGDSGITGEAMPKGSDSWDADSIASLRAWIDAGANP